MSDELDYRWRSVKDYGQPDAKTCPWGYRWRNGKATGMASEVWSPLPNVVEWQPLPPPCDKVMPSPEPDVAEKIADYVQTHRGYRSMTPRQTAVEAVRVVIGDEAALRDVIAAARPDWMGVLDAVEAGETVGPAAHQQGGAMTHRTVTIPPVTAALLAHEVTDWSTHDYRGSAEVGDRGIIVAGADLPKHTHKIGPWLYEAAYKDCLYHWDEVDREIPVHSRAAVAVGTVADVVPIHDADDDPYRFPVDGEYVTIERQFATPHLWHHSRAFTGARNRDRLLPFSDWSPTTDTGKQRWAVRWEDMRVLDLALAGDHVTLHRGWQEADTGLIAACGEAT